MLLMQHIYDTNNNHWGNWTSTGCDYPQLDEWEPPQTLILINPLILAKSTGAPFLHEVVKWWKLELILRRARQESAKSEFSSSWRVEPLADRGWRVGNMSGKVAVDDSVGDGTFPVSSLLIHRFEFFYLKTGLCNAAFDKPLALQLGSWYTVCEMSNCTKVLSDWVTNEASSNAIDSKHQGRRLFSKIQ